MSIVVFWLKSLNEPMSAAFSDDQLKEALDACADLRRDGFHHVSMSSENENQVGGNGVDSVENGKLPDGSDYTWRKRRP